MEEIMKPWEEYQQAAPTQGIKPWEEYGGVSQPEYEAGIARTALDQGLQGATLGFADEVTDRLGAGIASLVTDRTYNDLLNEARGDTLTRQQAQMEQRPALTIGANLAGGLLTGGAGATTKAGTTLTNSLRTGNLAARAGKAAALGTTSGGVYGFGAGEGDVENRLESAKDSAATGLLLGAALPVAGAALKSTGKGVSNAYKGAKARGAEELAATASNIKDEASQAYQKMRDVGAVLNRNKGVNIANKIQTTISKQPLNKRLHGDTMSVLGDFKGRAKQGDLGLEELDQFRQLFGEVISKNTDITGKMSPDGRLARRAIAEIDNAVDGFSAIDFKGGGAEAAQFLKQGRAVYAKSRKFEDISRILQKADGDPNKIKSGLTRFLNNPKKIKGYSPSEIDALKNAANMTVGERVMKSLGKFGFDLGTSTTFGNTALPVVGTALGGASSAGLGAAVPAVGTTARQIQKYLARGKAEDLLKVIEAGGKVPQSKIMRLRPVEINAVMKAKKELNLNKNTK